VDCLEFPVFWVMGKKFTHIGEVVSAYASSYASYVTGVCKIWYKSLYKTCLHNSVLVLIGPIQIPTLCKTVLKIWFLLVYKSVAQFIQHRALKTVSCIYHVLVTRHGVWIDNPFLESYNS
jgi:hypothetical protein